MLDFSEVEDTGGVEVVGAMIADGKANLVSSCGRGSIEKWTFDLWKEGKREELRMGMRIYQS